MSKVLFHFNRRKVYNFVFQREIKRSETNKDYNRKLLIIPHLNNITNEIFGMQEFVIQSMSQ